MSNRDDFFRKLDEALQRWEDEILRVTRFDKLLEFLYKSESHLQRRCRNAKILWRILLLECSKLKVYRHPSILYKLRKLNEIDRKIILLFEEIEGIG